MISKAPQKHYQLIIDALFGTGLNRPVTGAFADAIAWINQQQIPVLAVDIPSGLNTNTGSIEGIAVQADQTITMICHKPGLYTQHGKDLCGDIVLESLMHDDPPQSTVADTWSADIIPQAWLLDRNMLTEHLGQRPQASHKGTYGHVLIAGGQTGMPGAVILTAEAALRSGCGSTTVLTHPDHTAWIPMALPETMSQAFEDQLPELTKMPQAIAVGMGLGNSDWSQKLLKNILSLGMPSVIDAEALRLIRDISIPANSIITPHPGEAAELLETSIQGVQNDRLAACEALCERYQTITVLKGAGTVISNGSQHYICPYGSANLATAGSGDVLSGIIAGLLAQGFNALQAAQLGVLWHAVTGEDSDCGRSLIASDISQQLHMSLNSQD